MIDVEPDLDSGYKPVRRRSRRMAWLVGLVLLAVALGVFGLTRTGSNDQVTDEVVSSAGEFLTPSEGAEGTSPRLGYRGPDGVIPISNGGVLAISESIDMLVSVTPFPPTSLDFSLDLAITTPAGEPVTNASVQAIWDMAVMSHGSSETAFIHVGDGHYVAPFETSMYGPWEFAVTVVADGATHGPLNLSLYVWPE